MGRVIVMSIECGRGNLLDAVLLSTLRGRHIVH